MAKQTINIGSAANDGTGSTLRAAFDITNDNFTELYDGSGGLLHKIEGTNFTGSLLIGHSTTGTLSAAIKNTGVGVLALDALTSGDSNTAIGYNAGSSINSGSFNILIGTQAGDALTSGTRNIAIGNNALTTEDGHGRNVAIGHNALYFLNTGADAYNVAVGYDAGVAMTTGVQNTIIGGLAGDAIESGQDITALGYNAAAAITGSSNTCIGSGAGSGIVAGTDNTMIGKNTTLAASASNSIVIGSGAGSGSIGSNTVVFGNSNITDVIIPADSTLKIGASSDLQLEHLSSNSFIKNTAVGDLYIENQVDDKDVIFRSDDGSGGLATYFFLDGSSVTTQFYKTVKLYDAAELYIGDGNDLRLYHNATNSNIENFTGTLQIIQNTDDGDISFKSDDGSGGTTEYFRLDGGTVTNIFSQHTNFIDSKKALFGTGSDLEIYHNGTDSKIENTSGNLEISNYADDKDIIFKSDDGSGGTTNYLAIDGGDEVVRFYKTAYLTDNIKALFGNSSDLQIYHDSSDSIIEQTQTGSGDLILRNANDDKDIIFQSDDGSGGLATYFFLDGSNSHTNFQLNARWVDSAKAQFGNSGDLEIFHDGSNTYIENYTGSFIFTQALDDGDMIFKSDDGSGGTTEYFRVDGGNEHVVYSKPTIFSDNVKLKFGDGIDLEIYHDTSNNYIENNTNDLIIQNTANDRDIIFKCDDGSGGVETYFFLDGSASSGNPFTVFPDLSELAFGTSRDLKIKHDSTDSSINNNTGDLYIKNSADDKDIIFQSDDGSGGTTEYFRLDGSAAITEFSLDARIVDNKGVLFGSGGDSFIKHTGSNMSITNDTGHINIVNRADNSNIIFQTDDGSGGLATYFTVDGANEVTSFQKHTKHEDSIVAYYGNGSDLQISHNGTDSQITNTTGHLQFTNVADDKDITFASDNGSGGDTVYLTLDGGDVSTIVHTIKVLMPNLPTSDPSVAGQLYTDSGVLKVSAG